MNGERISHRLAVLSLLLAFGVAAGPVWEVRQGDHVLYLGGTCHILRPADYPLPAVFDTAYSQATRLVFETDIGAMRTLRIQRRILAGGSYTDGRTLKTLLAPETYAALDRACTARNLKLKYMDRVRAAVLVTNLMMMQLQEQGIAPGGVDQHLYDRAVAAGKPVAGLETIEHHIDLVLHLGEGEEEAFVRHSLAELEELPTLLDQLIAAWREGDAGKIHTLMNGPMKEQFPKLYKTILSDRNAAWLPAIDTYLASPEPEFILVGVAHVVGPDGLLAALEQRGCTVRKLE